MVGFVSDSSIKVKEEIEEKRPIQPAEKSIDPLDFSEFDHLSDSFLDFDCLKDWIEENPELYMAELQTETELGMLDSVKAEFGVVEKSLEMGIKEFRRETNAEDGCGRLGNFSSLIEKEMGKVSLEGVSDGPIAVKVNCSKEIDEFVSINGNGVKSGEIVTVKCEVMENSEIVGANDNKKSNEILGIDGNGLRSGEIATVMCEGEKRCEMVGAVGDDVSSNEVASVDGNCVVTGNTLTVGSTVSNSGEKVSDEKESDSESESESANSSSPSSSSSSSSSEDDDEEEEEKEEGELDVEEGEIRESFGEEMVAWSDEDDEGLGSVKAGPILSKNEIKVLPPVPPVDVTLQSYHQTLPVGVVLSIVGAQVIVEGVEKHNPLNEGSILWITEKRLPLGIVDEIFGPVKNPYYMVRYNSDSEVPSGIQEGTLVSFVPEFVNHVLNDSSLYKKGYDASNENDEELSDEAEFSDDEKEAEYKRMQKMSKRGTKDQTGENRKKIKSKFRNRGGQWESDQPSSAKQPTVSAGKVPFNQSQHFFQSATASSLDQVNCSHSSGPVQGISGGPGVVPTFPQLAQGPLFAPPSSGVWVNGIQCQQPLNMGFPNGTPNNMPWIQQNHPQQPYQMPLLNGVPFQQQFNTGQMLPSNFVLPGGQPSFSAGPTFTPWNPMLIGQNSFNQSQPAMGMQGQHAPASMNIGEQGVSSSGFQIEQNRSFQPPPGIPGNIGASQNFNQGGNFGRGGKPYRRGGGRFGGGRGRQQPR